METGSNAQFVIRRATRDDLPQLSALLERYYTEWDVVQRDVPERVGEYLDQPAPFGFVIVEEKGTLVACVLLRGLPSIASAAECKRLYVVPEHRGEGLASLLMDYVEGFAAAGRLDLDLPRHRHELRRGAVALPCARIRILRAL